MPPGCRLWLRRISVLFGVFWLFFSLGLLDMVVVIPAKLSAMDFGELEIVFDAVV